MGLLPAQAVRKSWKGCYGVVCTHLINIIQQLTLAQVYICVRPGRKPKVARQTVLCGYGANKDTRLRDTRCD